MKIFFGGLLDPPARVWKSSLFLNPQIWQAYNEEVDQTPGVLDCSHSLGCNSTQLLGSNTPFNDVVTEEAIKVLSFIRGLLFVLFVIENSSKLVHRETIGLPTVIATAALICPPLIAIIKIHSQREKAFKQESLRCVRRILNENVQ